MVTGSVRFLPLIGVAMLAGMLAPPPARAHDDDQVAVREAVARGRILPLEEVLRRVRGKVAGDIVGVKIEREHRWLYEIRVLAAGGRLFEVEVDAGSGEIERIKEK